MNDKLTVELVRGQVNLAITRINEGGSAYILSAAINTIANILEVEVPEVEGRGMSADFFHDAIDRTGKLYYGSAK